MQNIKTFMSKPRKSVEAIHDAWFKLVDIINWVAGFPGAVIYNYRRQRELDRKLDNLTDHTFLDRVSKDQ